MNASLGSEKESAMPLAYPHASSNQATGRTSAEGSWSHTSLCHGFQLSGCLPLLRVRELFCKPGRFGERVEVLEATSFSGLTAFPGSAICETLCAIVRFPPRLTLFHGSAKGLDMKGRCPHREVQNPKSAATYDGENSIFQKKRELKKPQQTHKQTDGNCRIPLFNDFDFSRVAERLW